MITLLDTDVGRVLHVISGGWSTSIHFITTHVKFGTHAVLLMINVEPMLLSVIA